MSKAVKVASLLYAVSILLSRVIGLVRESVIGRVLGESGEADVYWVAFILPDFLNYLLAGGALSLVLIPLLQTAETRGGQTEKWACFWRVATPLTAMIIALTAIAWVSIDALTSTLAPGFTEGQLQLLAHLSRIILPAQIFHLCGGLLSATLQADDRHLAPALAPLLYTGSIVLGGVLLGPTLGAEGFAWGVLGGSILGPFGCPLLASIKRGLKLAPQWTLNHEDVKTYAWRAVPVMLGFSVVVLDEMLVKRWGTSLAEGTVAQLHYARTLMRVPMGVFGLAMGVAAFPTLSRLCAQGHSKEAFELLNKAAEALLLLVGLSQVFLTASGTELAALIWGQERMSPEGLSAVGLYCGGLSLGLWAWSLQGIAARGFYAQGETWLPTLLGSVVMILALPLYARWVNHGGIGLTLASTLAISTYVSLLWVLVSRSLGGRASTLFWIGLKVLFCVIASLAVVEALYPLWGGLRIELISALGERLSLFGVELNSNWIGENHRLSSPQSPISLLLSCMLKGVVGTLVFILIAWGLRVPALSLLATQIQRRLQRTSAS